MSKYIPVDKLIAKIDRRIEETKSMKPSFDQFWAGQISAFKGVKTIITSLQQEQPEKGLDVTEFCKPINPGIAKCIADHWWELLDDENVADKKAATEIVKEQPEVDLDALVDEAFDKYSSVDGYGQLSVSFNRSELYSFIKKIARKEE